MALTAFLCSLAATGWAQAYPSKPIRWVVPSSPGGSADAVTRVVANALPPVLGQRVIVDNRAGASGNIGADHVAKSAPDGYTWIMMNNAQAANVSLYKNLTYDLMRDFAPVMQVDSSPHVVVVHPTLPVKSISELVKLAKEKPGTIDYASAGLGTVTFLAAELFKAEAGIKLTHVPYKGGGESLTSIIAGETIAVIHHAVAAALKAPDASKRLSEMSSAVIANQPEEFGAFLRSEVDGIAAAVRKLNLSAELK